MADISKIQVPGSATQYNIKDAQARRDIEGVKADLGDVNNQMPDVTGTILPPAFAIGSRYVQNGVDKWASNANRLSFAQGTFISLKAGDIVNKTSDVDVFSGGYTTDNGSTFTAISNTFGPYEVPEDGLYFFNLSKPNSGEWTDTDIPKGREYITFFRAGSLKDSVTALENDTSVANIKEAIGYEIGIIEPTEFYTMPYEGKGLNASGVLTDDTLQDTSDYIELTDFFYGVARVVNTAGKVGLGSICYYTSKKAFIKRVQPGTAYDFVTFNGEKVAWLPIDKTVANAKYIRFCGRNDYGFRYWIVYNGYKVGVLDQYKALPLYGKKIVNFGDSIFGNRRPPKDISSYLANLTGATVYNCGFGGCEMSVHSNANYTPFSMCSLADSIASVKAGSENPWTTQEANAALSGMPAYFSETVALLKTINWDDVDIITIAYGSNDFNNGSPLDNSGNSDTAYFADALRYSIETILTAYPQIKIFVCSIAYRAWLNASYEFIDDTNTHTVGGNTTAAFNDKLREVSEEYCLTYIDDYNIGINRYNRLYYFPTTDGAHHNQEGARLIAENIANKLF